MNTAFTTYGTSNGKQVESVENEKHYVRAVVPSASRLTLARRVAGSKPQVQMRIALPKRKNRNCIISFSDLSRPSEPSANSGNMEFVSVDCNSLMAKDTRTAPDSR